MKDGQHGLTKSHITEHIQRLRHKIDWQNYSNLARASNDYYLKIKESLLIKERMPIMNNNETSVILAFRLIALIIHGNLLLTVSFRPTFIFGLNYLCIE